MKLYLFIVVVIYLDSTNSTFWFENDFELLTDPYSTLSVDYFSDFSIFEQELQLLDFYPIALYDDGLEYLSMIDDDYDDRMYELKMKKRKRKKSKRKLKKKKSRSKELTKSIRRTTTRTTTTTSSTTAKPSTNNVYYWRPIPTDLKTESSNDYEESFSDSHPSYTIFETTPYEEDSELSEENNTDVGDIRSASETIAAQSFLYQNENKEIGRTEDPDIDNRVYSTLLRKLKIGDNEGRSNSEPIDHSLEERVSFTDDIVNRENYKTFLSSTTSKSTTSTSTSYPLLTVFTDPDEIEARETLDQREIIDKISHEEDANHKVNEIVPTTEDHIELTTVSNFENYLQRFGDDLHQSTTNHLISDKLDQEVLSETTDTKYGTELEMDLHHHLEDGWSSTESIKRERDESESRDTDDYLDPTTDFSVLKSTTDFSVLKSTTDFSVSESTTDFSVLKSTTDFSVLESTTENSVNIEEISSAIPSVVLDSFPTSKSEHGTHLSSISSSSYSKGANNISASIPPEHLDISVEIPAASAGNIGHEIHLEHNDSIPKLNKTAYTTTQPLDEDRTSSKKTQSTNKMSDSTDIISQSNEMHYDLSTKSANQSETGAQTNTEHLYVAIDRVQLNDIIEPRELTDAPVIDDAKIRRSDVAIEADDFLDEDATDDLPYNLSAENVLERSNLFEKTFDDFRHFDNAALATRREEESKGAKIWSKNAPLIRILGQKEIIK